MSKCKLTMLTGQVFFVAGTIMIHH